MAGLRRAGLQDLPVILGGIIPEGDVKTLLKEGIMRIYTPKDYDLDAIIDDIAEIVESANDL
jgi:(2R)-ethylmalonyl-CoA mutase